MEIIGITVDHHCAPDDIAHPKAVCTHCKKCATAVRQQRRKIPRMVWMVRFFLITMAARFREFGSKAGASFMDVKREKTGSEDPPLLCLQSFHVP